jgi:hypothetical protein
MLHQMLNGALLQHITAGVVLVVVADQKLDLGESATCATPHAVAASR